MMPTRTMQKIARAIVLTKGVSCRPASEPMRTIMAARAKRLMPNVARRRLNFSWTVIARYSSNENSNQKLGLIRLEFIDGKRRIGSMSTTIASGSPGNKPKLLRQLRDVAYRKQYSIHTD